MKLELRKRIHVTTCTDVPGPSRNDIAQKYYSALEEAQIWTLTINVIERQGERIEQAPTKVFTRKASGARVLPQGRPGPGITEVITCWEKPLR